MTVALSPDVLTIPDGEESPQNDLMTEYRLDGPKMNHYITIKDKASQNLYYSTFLFLLTICYNTYAVYQKYKPYFTYIKERIEHQ